MASFRYIYIENADLYLAIGEDKLLKGILLGYMSVMSFSCCLTAIVMLTVSNPLKMSFCNGYPVEFHATLLEHSGVDWYHEILGRGCTVLNGCLRLTAYSLQLYINAKLYRYQKQHDDNVKHSISKASFSKRYKVIQLNSCRISSLRLFKKEQLNDPVLCIYRKTPSTSELK